MWANALALLARADRMHRDFFRPMSAGWEPPVDVLETDRELIVIVALPGVQAGQVDLVAGSGELAIVGNRPLPPCLQLARVHRMELPYGRFERRVILPAGEYELSRREMADGCLTIVMRKVQ
jgi:HSP20 family protein